MTLSTSPGAYADVEEVLNEALRIGGAKYELETKADATRFTARAYRFRSILYDLKRREYEDFKGLRPSTPYDHMFIQKEGNVVVISFRKPAGKLTTLAGEPVEFTASPPRDEMDEQARALALELGIDDAR